MLRRLILPVTIASITAGGFCSLVTPASAQEVTAAARKDNIHRYLLDIYTKQRKFGEATVEYNAVLATKGSDPTLRYNYALFLAQQGKTAAARDQMKKASTLDPSNGDIWGALGKIQIQLKDFAGAQGSLQRAIQLGKPEYRKDYDSIKQYIDHINKQAQYQAEMKRYNEQKKKAPTPASSSDDDDE